MCACSRGVIHVWLGSHVWANVWLGSHVYVDVYVWAGSLASESSLTI